MLVDQLLFRAPGPIERTRKHRRHAVHFFVIGQSQRILDRSAKVRTGGPVISIHTITSLPYARVSRHLDGENSVRDASPNVVPSPMIGDQRRGAVAQNLLTVRGMRKQSFPSEIFDEHAWNMLLYLFSALVDNRTISEEILIQWAEVSHPAGVRWLKHLVEDGQIEARDKGGDVALTVEAIERMRTFLDAADAVHSGTRL